LKANNPSVVALLQDCNIWTSLCPFTSSLKSPWMSKLRPYILLLRAICRFKAKQSLFPPPSPPPPPTPVDVLASRDCRNDRPFRKTWGSHGGEYEEWRLLGCYAVWLLREPSIRRNLAPPSSGWQSVNCCS
jgi:hypothetical protein